MAKKVYESDNIQALADKMRELTGATKKYTTYDFADGVEEVYNVGYAKGSADCSNTIDALIDGSITSISSSTVTEICWGALHSREKLVNVDFPNVIKIGEFAFNSCYSLERVNLPNCRSFIDEMCMAYCFALQSIDLPKLEYLGYASFEGCKNLTSVTIRTPFVCRAIGDMFVDTPISNGKGYIYVPTDLVDSYKSATNWSIYADQIRPIQE